MLDFLFIIAFGACIIAIITNLDSYEPEPLIISIVVFALFAGWLGISVSQDWRVESETEFTVRIIDGVAIVKDGSSIINVNRAANLNFTEGDTVRLTKLDRGPYFGVWYIFPENTSIWTRVQKPYPCRVEQVPKAKFAAMPLGAACE